MYRLAASKREGRGIKELRTAIDQDIGKVLYRNISTPFLSPAHSMHRLFTLFNTWGLVNIFFFENIYP